ncbi:hypothetical protein [Actinokineospora xionganensis]|uniref:LPXTG-motif cell wall-anchored protein n=1 Tax=Actinokineospora xionganensis TaxID=2684470 RepID=A0ABR7L0I8_9PSEU|nr:hypothetical protein [Actinokineospora xionganensis]MBC6446195.1 hypothetical protein [Actinokineospora xionganensis]
MRVRNILTTVVLSGALVGGPGLAMAWAEQPEDRPGNTGRGQSGQVHGKPAPADTTVPQPPSNADFTDHGADTHGPYDSTRDGSPSGNGNGGGEAVGKPCAGCVGKADNKNPKGQLPGPQDGNKGYECDGNKGIGRSNPAHTGCKSTTTTTPPPPTTTTTTTTSTTTVTKPGASTVPAPQPGINPAAGSAAAAGAAADTTALADTGVNLGVPVGAGLLLLGAGTGLILVGRRRPAD